jgi:uncharacterized membrane protein YesL
LREGCEAVHILPLAGALIPVAENHLQEPPMPLSLKELEQIYRRNYRRSIIGIFIVYGTALLTALLLLSGNPKVATWVSEAVQAEFASTNAPSTPEPARLARPVKPVRTVKAE